jgi:hypothetical protein
MSILFSISLVRYKVWLLKKLDVCLFWDEGCMYKVTCRLFVGSITKQNKNKRTSNFFPSLTHRYCRYKIHCSQVDVQRSVRSATNERSSADVGDLALSPQQSALAWPLQWHCPSTPSAIMLSKSCGRNSRSAQYVRIVSMEVSCPSF